MNYRKWLSVWVVLVIAAGVWALVQVQAQPPCPYADIRLDTDQPVDVDAICQAARPWADDGFQVFILLTDYRVESEDEWFAFLDQMEAEAGLRDLGQPDSFDKNALAFEAGTATDLNWGYSVTFGERLFGSPLDTDEALVQIENQMRAAITAGDPTGAFVQALTTSYEIYHPPLSPWLWTLLAIPVLGALGVGGWLLVPRVTRHLRLKRHLELLRARTSNLLVTCDQLLEGHTPEETILYQLFSAYGGERYASLRAEVREWLRRSQEALNDAFDLRQKLIDPAAQKARPLDQQVRDWEMLYVTLVGSNERILALTDDELRTLVDPMLVLDREAADVQLAEQLDAIRREFADMPLKIELMMIDPAQTDAEGILGYIDQVKAQIARLRDAQHEAPERLAAVQAQRDAVEREVPSPFVLTGKQLLAGIDNTLAQMRATLEQGLFLRVLEQAADVQRDIEVARTFLAAMSEHDRQRADIDAITAQGYRPPHLADDLQEIETDVQAATRQIIAGEYVAVRPWIEELNADSQRALAGAQAWRALHDQNATALQHLSDEVQRAAQHMTDEAVPAYHTLQTYAEGNWADVADEMEETTGTLQSLLDDVLSQIAHLNSMEEQRFAEAEQRLAQALAHLAQAEGQLQTVVDRLAEVQRAEAHIQEGLRLTEADIAKAEALRDREDVKIGAEVDEQIAQARRQLADGQRLMEAGEFLAAATAQAAARQLATAAYAAASEQVREINALQQELEVTARGVEDKVDRCRAEAAPLSAVAQTTRTNDLVRRAAHTLSEAQRARTATTGLEDRAWAQALRAAITTYKQVGQLADEAIQRIAADREEYDRYLTDARNAIRRAERAIREAERVGHDPDAGGAGRRTLTKARDMVPTNAPIKGATKEALSRIRQRAEEAQRVAEQAAHLARQRIREVQAERDHLRREAQRRRQAARASATRSRVRVPSRQVSSGASSRRAASRGSSSRASSQSTSRRSSSQGTSKRSSSRGASKRRSSKGSSRRR